MVTERFAKPSTLDGYPGSSPGLSAKETSMGKWRVLKWYHQKDELRFHCVDEKGKRQCDKAILDISTLDLCHFTNIEMEKTHKYTCQKCTDRYYDHVLRRAGWR